MDVSAISFQGEDLDEVEPISLARNALKESIRVILIAAAAVGAALAANAVARAVGVLEGIRDRVRGGGGHRWARSRPGV